MSALLTVDGLSVSFPRSGRVVDDVSLTIDAGEVLALVGESGSGKSVTGRAITRLLGPGGTIEARGIDFDGVRLSDLPERRLRDVRGADIGMVFQDPTSSLDPTMPVGEQIVEEVRRRRRLSRRAARSLAIEMLQRVGIDRAEQRARQYPHQFSGGQRQRIGIAMAVVSEPRLLIADEPTTALDVTVQAQILDLLRDLQRSSGMAVLLITHDLGVVRSIADRVTVMHRGRIVETGTVDQVLSAPREPYTRELIAASRTVRSRTSPPAPEPLLRIQDLTVVHGAGSRASTVAVDAVSLDIGEGEIVGVVGESGSGKSSLARAVLGLYPPRSGELRWRGEALPRLERRTSLQRRSIQMVFQDPFGSLHPRMTVRENVREGLDLNRIGRGRAARDALVDDVLESVGIERALADRYPHEFSGGQRQRVGIARALVVEPTLLVCDEPTSALDVSIRAQVVELLLRLQRERGLSYLFISHDLSTVHQVSDRIAVMREGRIVEIGTADDVARRPQHPYTRELMSAELKVDG